MEAADGGTLFLDEIGELPLEAQARLLRVLQEGEIRRVGSVQSQKVDVRLIAATHRDLKSLAKIGQFREDLYYRLHVIALKLPALRERGADVNEIATAFLARQSARVNRTDLKFALDAEQAIRHYSWPGNVRELENAVERAVILCESPEISAELLGIDIELSDLDDDDFIGLAPQQGNSGGNTSHEPTEDLSPGRLLPAFRSRASGPHDRNRAGPQTRGQSQMPVGTPSAPGHSAAQDRGGQRELNRTCRMCG